MSADGLTKALPKDRWPDFLQQLQLVDISQQLKQRRDTEQLQTLEDRFEMLEID